MPDEQNTNSAENENIQAVKQNPVSEKSSIPPSPQEPTEQVPENTVHSEPSFASPEVTEVSGDDFPLKSNDIIPSDSSLTEVENEPKIEEKQAQNESILMPVSEPVQATEPPDSDSSPQATAQMAGNEPLSESIKPEAVPLIVSNKNKIIELLDRAKNAIQFRKIKKLDRVMSLFLKQSKITNDEVEKFLHVSDATATRYLSILEKEEKIKQTGKTGHSVFYSKI